MSEILTTEAIVLRAMKYRESSKIVTLYTRGFGRVSTIVKGARRAKNRYGSSLEPMSYVSVVFYKKEGRELQTLAQSDVVRPMRRLGEDLEKMSVGMTIVELVNVVAHEEEKHEALFDLLSGILVALNETAGNALNLLYAFEIQLARALGFQPRFDACVSCGRPLGAGFDASDQIPFHLGRAGPLCGDCRSAGGQTFLLTRGSLLLLQQIASVSPLSAIPSINIGGRYRAEIGSFLWSYLRYHVSGMRELRSEKVFSMILPAS